MNRITFGMFVAILVNLSGYAELKLDPQYRKAVESGAATRIDAHVVDDEGAPVRDAEVKAVFAFQDGERSGTYVSDSNGVAVVEGITTGHYVELDLSKEGYYDSKAKYRYLRLAENRLVKDGKWQPWGKEERIVLRKIKNPIELKRQSIREYRDVDIINEWVGFDLERNDFVAHNHMGKNSDFEVRFIWDGKWIPDYTGMTVEIRFPQKDAGGYWVKDCQESDFKGAYAADSNAAYVKEFSFFEKNPKGGSRTYKHFDPDKSLVVRCRCVFDESENLIAANYARIDNLGFSCAEKGIASLHVISVFNPTPNDTNLEQKR